MNVHLHTASALSRYKANSPSDIVDVKEGPDLVEMLNQGIATPAKGKGGDSDAAKAEKREKKGEGDGDKKVDEKK